MSPTPTRCETLADLSAAYAALENRIREGMRRHVGHFCRQCPRVCCHPGICREAGESLFLKRVRALQPPEAAPACTTGWLTPVGCALRVGRPPVCYEFLCDPILQALPEEKSRQAVLALGRLLSVFGRNALGSRHLVTIHDPETLGRVKPERFQSRLEKAFAELDAIEFTLTSHRPGR